MATITRKIPRLRDLKFVPRTELYADCVECRYFLPEPHDGYHIHVIYRKSTEHTLGYQFVLVDPSGNLVGQPRQTPNIADVNRWIEACHRTSYLDFLDKEALFEQLIAEEVKHSGFTREQVIAQYEEKRKAWNAIGAKGWECSAGELMQLLPNHILATMMETNKGKDSDDECEPE